MRKKVSESKDLLKQWNYKRNTGLNLEELTQGSGKKAWWICDKGHEWKATIAKRTLPKKPSGCPYCAGKKAGSDNNLAVLNPSLAKQWHPTMNYELTPDMVTPGSNQKAWWICDNGHEWEASINNRNKGRGCAYCSGRRASLSNNLAVLNPSLTKQWHPTMNYELTPKMVTLGSNKKVWWICDKGHEWEAVIASRASANSGCPYCSGLKIGLDNNLTVLYPTIAKQWHPTKNGELTPDTVSPGGHNKVWWICEKGHEWKASTGKRTRPDNPTGCPKCTNQSSEPEIRILTELMYIFDDVTSRHKIKSLELDIYIPPIKIGIEYDGSYYHKNKESQDKSKNKAIEKEGVKLIRVRHHPLRPISSLDIIHIKDKLTKDTLDKLMSTIKLLVDKSHLGKINSYLLETEFVNQSVFQEYMSYFPDPFPESSLEHLSPKLCEEWNYKKNKPLLPSNFTPGSGKKVWWVCGKGHEWEAVICSRKRSGCPYCAGKKVGSDNNLEVLNPEIAKQWHPTKNGELTPEVVTLGSNKKVWWVCGKGHEWEAIISHRTSAEKPTGCPYCSGLKIDSGNNLAVLYPTIAKQWHPTKNGELTPEVVSPGTDKKAWWVCGKGHEWEAVICSRKRSGCPYCAGKKVGSDNNLAISNPEIAKQWHPTKNGELTPDMVTSGSGKDVWWACNKGHEWKAVIYSRKKNGCPHCAGKRFRI